MSTLIYKNPNECVSSIIDKIGNEIVIVVPLGLGKPVQLLNAFYSCAKKNKNIQLKIITALTLMRPRPENELANRFAGPIIEKLYGNYIDLEYEVDRRLGKVPKNVQILEFFLNPGCYIHNNQVQQDYISSNYTHVIRDALFYKINVIAQLISCQNKGTGKFSLSCNADLTLDLLNMFKESENNVSKPLCIGEINPQLPYMYGESAELDEDSFDAIIDNNSPVSLFTIPRPPISKQEFMIGLYTSTLIRDDGCLEVGIGNLGEALCYNLIVRHKNNKDYLQFIEHAKIKEKFGTDIENVGQTSVFSKGLFASTEMLVDGILDLYKNNILTKTIDGSVVHAGFFVGSRQLQDFLRNLDEAERRKFDMRGVKTINQIYNIEKTANLQRIHARFVNSSMQITMLGEVISDTLENAHVVSGVGGQYNFVAMAHELKGARSIINCRSTYTKNGMIKSNIVWGCGCITIPRHLRDIVVTEYGIADLRSKTDSEVIKDLLNVADSRFQDQLLHQAKKYGKVSSDYKIPEMYRNNFPESIDTLLKTFSDPFLYKRYPFGTDLTDEEIQCEKSLSQLKILSRNQLFALFIKGVCKQNKPYEKILKRMNLDKPKNGKEYFYRSILKGVLQM